MDKVAVVILNWNGADMMRKYLPGVVASTETTSGARVYVADNGSTDGSMEMVGELFPTVGQVQLDRNYGFAEGYNLSLRSVDAEYYVLLNSVRLPGCRLDQKYCSISRSTHSGVLASFLS